MAQNQQSETVNTPAIPTPVYRPPSGTPDPNQWNYGVNTPQHTTGGTIGGYQPTSGWTTGSTDTPAPGTTPPTGVSQADSSAKAIIDGALGQYGLGSLSAWAWAKWQSGESIDQIMLELRDTPEYKTRFPAMAALSQRGRAISESQYINYEQSAAAVFRAAGLPAGFYDGPEDFAKFLTNDIALPELQQRVQAYQVAAFSSPPEVLNELNALYGVTPGELTAFFIDPDKALPLVQQRFASAQAAGWSQHTGFGDLSLSQAEDVGRLGLSEQQVAQGFGQLAQQNELFTGLVGTGEQNIGKDVGIGAVFDQNADDAAVLAARQRQRLAAFSGGGNVATNQGGAVGAGSAR